ncbi:MAG: hypothetical protein R2758_15875 [Bacteroidales bacterium]
MQAATTAEDIRHAVEQVCAGGLLPLSGRDTVVSRLTEMLTSDRVRHWFDGSSRVMTEATILLPGAARLTGSR